jgi:hypothetical protein
MMFPLASRATLARFRLFLVLTVLLAVATTWPTAGRIDAISLQFAATPARAEALLERWRPAGLAHARLAIYIDFAFLVVYSMTLALACAIVARELAAISRRWRNFGIALAWGMLLTALFDATENVAMLVMIADFGRSGHVGNLAPLVTTACASVKFVLFFSGVGYAVIGGLYSEWTPRRAVAVGVVVALALVIVAAVLLTLWRR